MLRDLLRHVIRFRPDPAAKVGVVDPPNVLQSELGRYFVGRTGLLHVTGGHEALVLFRTPRNASVRAFVVSVTVTSNRGRRMFFYFSPETQLPMQESSKVAAAYRGAPREAQAIIQMTTGPAVPLDAGVGVFERLLVGGDTLVLEQQGRIILEPGEGIGVLFAPIESDDDVDVALGWWEEPLV